MESFQEVAEFPCGGSPRELAFHDGGQRVLCSNGAGASVTVYNTETYRVEAVVEIGQDLPGNELGASTPVELQPGQLLGYPDGEFFLVSCPEAGLIGQIDTKTWQVTGYISVAPQPQCMVWWQPELD